MDAIRRQIRTAFATVEYPGDTRLRNSNESEEPFLLEAAFKGKQDWTALQPTFIDQAPDGFASALSFFSAAAFRFYLPAYLLADLDGQLRHSDPVFHLTHGLTDATMDVRVNPNRYGSYTWYDYARERFADFSIAQVKAIIAYLELKRDTAFTALERESIDQALENYWLKRANRSET